MDSLPRTSIARIWDNALFRYKANRFDPSTPFVSFIAGERVSFTIERGTSPNGSVPAVRVVGFQPLLLGLVLGLRQFPGSCEVRPPFGLRAFTEISPSFNLASVSFAYHPSACTNLKWCAVRLSRQGQTERTSQVDFPRSREHCSLSCSLSFTRFG